jgi:aryl-alcohol dehydrogenase-like predicted oxidoreductase
MTQDLRTPDGTPISRLCFGAMQFGGKADEAESDRLYAACREAGLNFFDTAYAYTEGKSETWLGRFAAPEREKVFIASKANFAGGSGAASIHASVEESRRRLGMDVIDLYYLHRWDGEVPLEETLTALAEEQGKGRIGRIGVSNFAAWQVMKAEAVAKGLGTSIAMIQPMYNLVKRQVEVEILPMALSEGFAVVPYSPLGGGLLSGKDAAGDTGRLTTDKMYATRYGVDWMHKAATDLAAVAAEVGQHPATLAVAWAGVAPPIEAAKLRAAPFELSPYRPLAERGFRETVGLLDRSLGPDAVIVAPKDVGYYFHGRHHPIEAVWSYEGPEALRSLMRSPAVCAVVDSTAYPLLSAEDLAAGLPPAATAVPIGSFVVYSTCGSIGLQAGASERRR